jgi:hypothetical protein
MGIFTDWAKETYYLLKSFIKTVNKNFENISKVLKAIKFALYKPGILTIVLTGEKSMSTISFKVVLPALVDTDVVSRELSVKIGEADAIVQTVAKDVAEVDGFSGEQDVAVVLSLTDIDDAGNRSEVSTLEDKLIDTFAPAKPGELSLVETGEQN